MLTAALWNFGINISGPFFSPHMVENLNFSAASVGFLAVVTSFSTLATQNQIGALADRLGSRRLQLASMCLIPLLPIAWIFSTQVWQIAIINTFSGVFWGTFNLVSFNLLLSYIPSDQVPRFSAVYQIVVMLSLALGALVGSALISRWGFVSVMVASAILRFSATGLFARLVHDPQKATPMAVE
jgi:predicted MFS family arabinose efflux permease